MGTKKYKDIRLDFTIYADDENMPEPGELSSGIFDGLPREWFESDEGYQVFSIKFGNFPDVRVKDEQIEVLQATVRSLHDQVENLVEKNDNQAKIISDQIDVIGTMTDQINDKRHEITGLVNLLYVAGQPKVKSVGCTTEEVEAVRDAINKGIDEVGQARIEDATGALDNLFEVVNDALKTLPVMDERDLGWGDDDDLSILEAQGGEARDAIDGLMAKLDRIRTSR